MRNSKIVVLTLTIALLSVLLVGCRAADIPQKRPQAAAGELVIPAVNVDNLLVRLDGQWEFYWQQLLSPDEFLGAFFGRVI